WLATTPQERGERDDQEPARAALSGSDRAAAEDAVAVRSAGRPLDAGAAGDADGREARERVELARLVAPGDRDPRPIEAVAGRHRAVQPVGVARAQIGAPVAADVGQ